MYYHHGTTHHQGMVIMCDTQKLVRIGTGFRKRRIDRCMIKVIQALNHNNKYYRTVACCCGHGKYNPTIIAQDKRTGHVFEMFSGVFISHKRKKKYYIKDNDGIYYIPSIEVKHVYEYLESGLYYLVKYNQTDIYHDLAKHHKTEM